jgi:hypothetical protein
VNATASVPRRCSTLFGHAWVGAGSCQVRIRCGCVNVCHRAVLRCARRHAFVRERGSAHCARTLRHARGRSAPNVARDRGFWTPAQCARARSRRAASAK